ncbi:MAG TPA: GNAT family N-acetyltransferase [Verrucomicrobiae bacterium]
MTREGFDLRSTLPTLRARRVRLRWMTESDVPSLFSIFGDREVTRYWGHAVLPDPGAARVLLEEIHTRFAHRSLLQWGVALLATDVVIGTCTLAALDAENRRAELGFALARAYWGQGYMSEALPVLLRFGFSELRLHRVWADTDPRNAASIRALERHGFRREGFLREHYLVQGEPQHAVVYGLLRSEWQRANGAAAHGTQS